MARPKKLPETLNAQERQALLSAPRIQAPTGHRDLCLITLMLNTGLRAAEVPISGCAMSIGPADN